MANLPLAFAELLGAAVLIDAGIKGASITDVVTGKAVQHPLDLSGSGAGAGAGATAGASTATGNATKMLAAAQTAVGGGYSQANHATAFNQAGSWLKQFGTDCSGFVSYLMGPQGLGAWSQPYTTDTLSSAPGISQGQGQQVTIWNNPAAGNAGHMFVNIAGQFFESAGGIGIHAMSAAEAQMYLASGKYQPWHPNGY